MEYISGNIFIRRMEDRHGFQPGHVIEGHTHNFDHTTILFSGRWRARKWLPTERGDWLLVQDIERDAPWHLLVEARARHEFTFLGNPVPPWMEPFLEQLPAAEAATFRDQYNKSAPKGWCIYSHRNPQGDVSESDTGWYAAYV